MTRRPPRSTPLYASAASDVYKRQTSLVLGASSVAQLEQNLGALDNLAFTDTDLAAIDAHAVDSGIDLWAPFRLGATSQAREFAAARAAKQSYVRSSSEDARLRYNRHPGKRDRAR